MRRNKQQLSDEECIEILNRGTSGVLALSGDGGYPYAVPISYALSGDKIYFHGAVTGHKVDAINRDSRASFCVIGMDEVVPEKMTTCFRSVIAFGKIRMLTDKEEMLRAVILMSDKYSPGFEKERDEEIERDWHRLGVIELTIEHLTGKEGMELIRRREGK